MHIMISLLESYYPNFYHTLRSADESPYLCFEGLLEVSDNVQDCVQEGS